MVVDSKAVDDDLLRDIESRAVQLVRQAGRMALERFRHPLRVRFKRENRADPVTDADLGIEEFLRTSIAREFPGHAILGEEGTEVRSTQNAFQWVLDPVDGTTNFVSGLPLFACSAALLHQGEPVVGAMFLPVAPSRAHWEPPHLEDRCTPYLELGSGIIHARLGGGAFLDGDPVRVSSDPRPEPSHLAGIPGHHARRFLRLRALRRNPGELRCLGSVCYETAMVACGVLRYALFHRPRLWDVAAGTLIVREAGGLALRWSGGCWKPLVRFEPGRNRAKPGEWGLRFWSAATLVGGDPVARFVAERLHPLAPGPQQIGRRGRRGPGYPVGGGGDSR